MDGVNFFLTFHLLILCSSTVLVPVKANNNETDLYALISFKSLISGDPLGMLSSWNNTLPHCQWTGVTCGRSHTDRVTALVLNSKELSGHISPSLANLTFLQKLSLSDNKLTGSIPDDLGRLSRLRFINFSINSLEGRIPSTLENCSNLKVLSLRNNNLGGTIPADLANCKKLTIVNLRKNVLVGAIPPEFGSLQQLTALTLGNNNLTGTIPPELGNLTNLQGLLLHFNTFKDSIPSSFGKLQSLESLYLYDNNISGKIPNSLYNISSIIDLELSTNQIHGTLPSDICKYFPDLQTLYLYENQLSGEIPISLPNCSFLSSIDIQHNSFTGTIPPSIGKLSYLYWLNAANNQFSAKIPNDWDFFNSLINCTDLQVLDLGDNQFEGTIPGSIANLSTSLYILALNSNPISGSIPRGVDKLTNLIALNLGQTLLRGPIPKEIGSLWKLQMLDLSASMMLSKIPSTFRNFTSMTKLYLQNNNLEGHIPPEISNMHVLELLNISNNKLIGEIPKEIMYLPSLSIGLFLSNNYLSGALPLEIGKMKNVMEVSLTNNNLSGEIPSTIEGCQLLQILHLNGNLFHGSIPPSMSNMKGLQELDLSNNNFSGGVPEFLAEMQLQKLNLSFNNFEGELPGKGVFRNISAINVSGNPKLCGGIPKLQLPKCNKNITERRYLSRRFVTSIILIATVLLFLLIILLLLISRYWGRRTQTNPQHTIDLKSQFNSVAYNELLRATNAFSLENIIGRGTFGVVYRAPISFDNVTTVVAVKVLNLEQHGACKSFLSECEALRNIRHRNVMKVLSVCSSIDHKGNNFKALVFEFMPNGSLDEWLHNLGTNRPFRSLNLIQMLNIAIDVAAGLDYLHNHGPHPIVHCDLKPSNVLLDANMTARIGDFGLARLLVEPHTLFSQSTASTVRIKGSIGYIPPEYGMGSQVSVEGDVYSYGILLFEMFTGLSPTDERFRDGFNLSKHVHAAFPEKIMDITDTKLLSVKDEGEMLYAIENVEDSLVSVISCGLMCSKESSKERITIKEVIKELLSSRDKLLRGHTTKRQIKQQANIGKHYV
ncbi:hypothetical protein LUZ62_050255 [Rhynchospora pubera]|uniref:Receptor kinase-like protein Xa21 n=1 Tax=Rhynchospora pubera TaxID=906938 RepID=A0AAV8FZX9_9POAL|nr:hypothetical protein LUZ62_050255 [Rhynchospora pubera]